VIGGRLRNVHDDDDINATISTSANIVVERVIDSSQAIQLSRSS